jgi:hypothetical protein
MLGYRRNTHFMKKIIFIYNISAHLYADKILYSSSENAPALLSAVGQDMYYTCPTLYSKIKYNGHFSEQFCVCYLVYNIEITFMHAIFQNTRH